MRRRSLLAALSTLPIVALSAQAATTFRDIPPGHWAHVPAGVLAERRVMGGRTPVDFAGEVPLTRYELAQILSGLYIESGPPATFIVLKDMPPGHEATRDVQRVLGYGLLEATKGGAFDGEDHVTRKELATALDTLLAKNGVSPPARRRQTVYFGDVPQGSPLFGVLDRVVNRYGLIEARPGSHFFGSNAVTRFQVLGILVKALPYLNPAIEREIQEAQALPTPSPGATDAATPSAAPATPSPGASASPTAAPGGGTWARAGSILRTRGRAQAEWLAFFSEDLPQVTGAVMPGEQSQSGAFTASGGVGFAGDLWSGAWGGTVALNAVVAGSSILHQQREVPIDTLFTTFSGTGLYRVAQDRDFEAALGGGLLFNHAFNTSGQLVSRYYLSADRTSIGAGPAAQLGFRAAPGLEFVGSALIAPLVQTYNLPAPSGAQTLTRIGSDLTGRAVYQLGDGWTLDGGLHLFLSSVLGGGGQTTVGLTLGASREF